MDAMVFIFIGIVGIWMICMLILVEVKAILSVVQEILKAVDYDH